MNDTWKQYEKWICKRLKDLYPNDHIALDQKVHGRYSQTQRQIDILATSKSAGEEISTIIDCKCFNRKIDVKDIEAFIGMVSDTGAHQGILITNVGYSNAAKLRAQNDPGKIRVRVIELEELDFFPGIEQAYAWRTNHDVEYDFGIFFPSPTGWKIHNKEYQLDVNFESPVTMTSPNINNIDPQNISNTERIQIDFSLKHYPFMCIQSLMKFHDECQIYEDPKSKIVYKPHLPKNSENHILPVIRILHTKSKLKQYTLFVDFDSFFATYSIFCSTFKSHKEIKKLEFIARKSISICQPTGYPFIPGLSPVTSEDDIIGLPIRYGYSMRRIIETDKAP